MYGDEKIMKCSAVNFVISIKINVFFFLFSAFTGHYALIYNLKLIEATFDSLQNKKAKKQKYEESVFRKLTEKFGFIEKQFNLGKLPNLTICINLSVVYKHLYTFIYILYIKHTLGKKRKGKTVTKTQPINVK